MIPLLLAGWLLAGPGVAVDTIVELRRGDRVVVQDLVGEIRVQAWDRSTLEVRRLDEAAPHAQVSRSGSGVTVGPADRKGRRLDIEAVLRVPVWADLEIRGRSLDVSIGGTGGSVSVRNVSGDIRVVGTDGDLVLSSVEGEIRVERHRGSVTARSRGDDVSLLDVVGPVDVSSGSGDLRLEDVEAGSVRAETLDGDVLFRGPIARGGTYSFSVHDGDASLEVPRSTSARVRVATFDGEFTSDFPVLLQRFGGGGVMDFTLGEGDAEIEIQVFDGEIRLRESGRR